MFIVWPDTELAKYRAPLFGAQLGPCPVPKYWWARIAVPEPYPRPCIDFFPYKISNNAAIYPLMLRYLWEFYFLKPEFFQKYCY